MGQPMRSEHYQPVEEPRMYPLELREDLHICLWDEEGTSKWTIAYWTANSEGYYLRFVGGRPLDKRVKWKKLKKIIKQGQKLADEKWNKEREKRVK